MVATGITKSDMSLWCKNGTLDFSIGVVHRKVLGVLRPGSTGFQDRFQLSYLHCISAQECVTDFNLHSREAPPL